MLSFRVMNAKERKQIMQQLRRQFSCDPSCLDGYAFLYRENREKIQLVNPAVLELPLDTLRVDTIGLYLGQKVGGGELRLSIEGSQLLGPSSTRNVINLSDQEFNLWMRGNDLEKDVTEEGFVILKHKDDYCGCGKPVRDERSKTTVIKNYIPKTRYVRGEE